MINLVWLGTLSLAMFTGSFLFGMVPLIVPLSAKNLNLMSAFGGGLLMGTALLVVIPEGIETLYTYAQALEAHHDHYSAEEHQHEHMDLGTVIGVSLLTGFSLMFFVDQMSSYLTVSRTHHHQQLPTGDDSVITMHTFESQETLNTRYFHDSPSSSHHVVTSPSPNHFPTTLGMIIHCAADGVAMGAAMSSGHSQLELLVFFAILLHKAPAAFGLTSFLMHSDTSKRKIRQILLLFSLSAPIATIITGLIFGMIKMDALNLQKWTSLLLMFSGGSFLYVAAVHVLPEVQGKHDDHGHEKLGSPLSPAGIHYKPRAKIFASTVIILIGMISPILLSFIHHEH